MNRRTETDGEAENRKPDTGLSCSGVRRLNEFRRDQPAACPVPAAGDGLPPSPAIPLGIAVRAVVLRLKNKRIRIRVARADREG